MGRSKKWELAHLSYLQGFQEIDHKDQKRIEKKFNQYKKDHFGKKIRHTPSYAEKQEIREQKWPEGEHQLRVTCAENYALVRDLFHSYKIWKPNMKADNVFGRREIAIKPSKIKVPITTENIEEIRKKTHGIGPKSEQFVLQYLEDGSFGAEFQIFKPLEQNQSELIFSTNSVRSDAEKAMVLKERSEMRSAMNSNGIPLNNLPPSFLRRYGILEEKTREISKSREIPPKDMARRAAFQRLQKQEKQKEKT